MKLFQTTVTLKILSLTPIEDDLPLGQIMARSEVGEVETMETRITKEMEIPDLDSIDEVRSEGFDFDNPAFSAL